MRYSFGEISEEGQRIDRLYRRHLTAAYIRHQSKKDYAAAKEANEAYWATGKSFLFNLETRPFLDRVIAEDGDERENAITFLEVDPWFNHSGYIKEKLIRAVKQTSLDAKQCDRLHWALLRIVEGRSRREFRDFCRLAARISTDDFYRQLQGLSEDEVAFVRRQAQWMIDYIDRHGC